jgi:hypothetical protein
MIKMIFDPGIFTKSQEELDREKNLKSSADLNTVKLIEKTIKKLCRKYKAENPLSNKRGCLHCPLMCNFNNYSCCPADNMLYAIKKYYKEYVDEKEIKKLEKEKDKRIKDLCDWYDKEEAKEMDNEEDDFS